MSEDLDPIALGRVRGGIAPAHARAAQYKLAAAVARLLRDAKIRHHLSGHSLASYVASGALPPWERVVCIDVDEAAMPRLMAPPTGEATLRDRIAALGLKFEAVGGGALLTVPGEPQSQMPACVLRAGAPQEVEMRAIADDGAKAACPQIAEVELPVPLGAVEVDLEVEIQSQKVARTVAMREVAAVDALSRIEATLNGAIMMVIEAAEAADAAESAEKAADAAASAADATASTESAAKAIDAAASTASAAKAADAAHE